MKSLLFIFLFSAIAFCSLGQDITTKDVNKEKKFIEALKEKNIGRNDKAIDILKELYNEDRTNPDIAFELAKLYESTNDHVLLEKFAKNAIENAPNNLWYLEYYGNFLMKENRPLSAITYFNKMVELQPENEKNYDRLAKAYILNNDFSKAIATLNVMESNFGPQPEILLSKFRLYDGKGDYPEAINELNKLISTYPNNEDYLLTKAKIYIKSGQQNLANDMYKAVLDIDPSNTEANLALLGQGDEIENENAYLRALLPIIENKTIPVDAKVKELLPYIQDLSNDKNVALKDALIEAGDRLIQTHPNEAKAYATYADILYNSGNLKSAIKNYKKTIELDDTVFPVWNQLMFALLEDANYDELLTVSTDCIDYFPNQASAFNFNGIAHTKLKNYQEATSILEEGLTISGSNKVLKSSIFNSLANNYLDQNMLEEAKGFIDKALDVSDQQNPLTYELLGDYFSKQNKQKDALINWEKSRSMGNSSTKLSNKIEGSKL